MYFPTLHKVPRIFGLIMKQWSQGEAICFLIQAGSQREAVLRAMPNLWAASRTDTPSCSTSRHNLLSVPTFITPAHPCPNN